MFDEGVEIMWWIENGDLTYAREFVTKKLEGSVSTPELGSVPPPNFYKERHEYTVVIELPHNVTHVIGDGVLVIDITIPNNDSVGKVTLLTTQPKLEYNMWKMWDWTSWTSSEAFWISKGGHLASVSSPFHWQNIQAVGQQPEWFHIWLGGTDEAKEGHWGWSDGSMWKEEHWASGQPSNKSGENCLELHRNASQHSWRTGMCTDQQPFICELPTTLREACLPGFE